MTRIGSLERFNKEVDAFSKNLTQVQIVIFQKAIAIEAFSRIVQKTPVDTGRARGGWQMTIGAPAEEETFNLGEPPVPELNLGPFEIVYIANNVPYIIFLEEGRPGPGSPQAPNGMVAETFEELLLLFPGGQA